MKNKFELYQEAKIPEYWVIHPSERSIMIYVLEQGIYKTSKPVFKEEYLVFVRFPQIKIPIEKVF